MKIRFLLPAALAIAIAACQPATAPTPATSPSPSASASVAPSASPSATPSATASPAETADVEGCEHLAEGPAVPVTATAGSGRPPMVDNDHKRYDITLKAATATDTGTTVQFQSDEAADYVLFLNKDIPVKVRNVATNTVVAIEASTKTSTACTTVQGRHVVELGIGVYAIEFGPTTETQVALVIEEAAGHGDDEHNDQ